MWPTALQMTRDECRGILRRLELESYSNVISVLRAQGGLNESKAKLLEELRSIFHISQERHRAEARRVANDEQLSTIAEAISGPNTWQEWSREGRRAFPLLPRVPPQTALSVIANNVAKEVTNENLNLPYPADTGMTEQAIISNDSSHLEKNPPIVTTDPNQPTEKLLSNMKSAAIARKNLKRNLSYNLKASNSTKRRHLFGNSMQSMNLGDSIGPYSSAAANLNSSSTSIRKLYNNHSRTQSKIRGSKKNNNNASGGSGSIAKRSNAGKGKRGNHQKQQKQLLKEHQAGNTPLPMSAGTVSSEKLITLPTSSQATAVTPHSGPTFGVATAASLSDHDNKKLLPQIATSKKDISKNLTKLNLPQTLHEKSTGVKSPILVSPTQSLSKTEKQLISTPVQKYIVEDRQPPPQSQYASVASKLRTMNPSTLSSGACISSAKLQSLKQLKPTSAIEQCSMPVTSQPQVFNVIEAQHGTTVSTNAASYVIPTPTHTSPSIIQLNSNKIQEPPEHGKVLTTKLLPLMLTSANAGITGNKLDSLNGSANSSNVTMIKGNITNISSGLQSSNSTIFRKPNIMKGGIFSNITKQSMATGSGNIVTNSTSSQLISNIKIPSQFQHLRSGTVTTKTNPFASTTSGIVSHKNVKIISSPNGKVFIRPDDSSSKTSGKLNTHHLSLQKSSGVQSGRVAIQKVQIIPAPVSSSGGSSTNLLQQQKSISISSKPGMIYVPASSSTVRSLTLGKSNKPSTTSNVVNVKSTSSIDGTKQQNVFVIGSLPQAQQQQQSSKSIKSISNENNLITEDTPVDILNTPIIVTDATGNSCNSIETTKKATSSGNKTLSDSGVRIESVTVLKPRIPIQRKSSTIDVSSNYRLAKQAANDASASESSMLNATDWEMELDQEAAKAKAAATQNKTNIVPVMMDASDHFDDVIVDESLIDGVEDVGNQSSEDLDEASSKMLNTEVEEVLDIVMVDDNQEKQLKQQSQQKQQQQSKSKLSGTTLKKKMHQKDDDDDDDEDDETIIVDDENQNTTIELRESNETDIIQFDESYESLDMDEDIAIEYIEDDQEMQEAYADKFVIKSPEDNRNESCSKQEMKVQNQADNVKRNDSNGNKKTTIATNCSTEKVKTQSTAKSKALETTSRTTSSYDKRELQEET